MTAYDTLPALKVEEARALLAKHSSSSCDVDDSAQENGFLGSLRPYRGTLNHAAFHNVMACLKALGPTLASGDKVDRCLVSDLWGICYLARYWATDPNGMLRRNHLITEGDIMVMTQWIDCISWATMMFLEGQEAEVAFEFYEDYVKETGI